MARVFAIQFAVYLLLWLLLAGSSAGAWVVGLPSAALAAWTGTAMAPSRSWSLRPLAAAAFVPFFLLHSGRGAWDVARRAMSPSLAVHPGRIRYPCRLPAGLPRTFFANVISLLPGTLFVADRNGVVELHAVDLEMPVAAEAARLEARVAAMFGVPVEPGE